MGVKGWPRSWPKASDLLSLSSALSETRQPRILYILCYLKCAGWQFSGLSTSQKQVSSLGYLVNAFAQRFLVYKIFSATNNQYNDRN